MSTPEFSRLRRLDTIAQGASVTVTAEPEERTALARRFGLLSVDRLEATYVLSPDGEGVRATGHLSAAVVQPCSVTDDPVPATVEEDFALVFTPEPQAAGEDEVELSEDALDVIFFAGGAIDLGEAAAETLALALDPYPRSPNAAAALREAGVISEDEAGPFGALAGLRDALKKD